MKVYLAGPDVFLPDARAVLEAKKDRCVRGGLDPLAPLDGVPPPGAAATDGYAIFRANRALMDRADLGLFNLSPFRGPGADPGTVFELGYLFARGRPVFGYTNDPATLLERTRRTHGGRPGEAPGTLVDPDGLLIEDFGLRDNLMLDGALQDSTGVFCAVEGGGLAAMAAFQRCLDLVLRHLGRDAAGGGAS